MDSWRDRASAETQDDLDEMLEMVLARAEETLLKHGNLAPFGASVAEEGEIEIIVGHVGKNSQPAEILESLYAGVDGSAIRAVAFVSDVIVDGSDAIRVELEHADGIAIAVWLPYSLGKGMKKYTFGQLQASLGVARIWG